MLGDVYGSGDANGIYVDVSSGVFMARSGTTNAKSKLTLCGWIKQKKLINEYYVYNITVINRCDFIKFYCFFPLICMS